jgi:hypothetical protein
MADLQDVVGAILRGVTEARAQADEAARALTLTYANDPVLRSFTVPRTEIRNLTIDLKVAIRSLDEATDDRRTKETRVRSILSSALANLPFASGLADELATGLKGSAEEIRVALERRLAARVQDEAEKRAASVSIEIYRDVLLVNEGAGTEIRIVPIAADVTAPAKRFTSMAEAKQGADAVSKLKLGTPLPAALQRVATTKTAEERKAIVSRLKSESTALVGKHVTELAQRIHDAMSAPVRKNVGVDVTAADLKDVPAHMISTVSLTLDVVGILPTSDTEA